MPKSQRPGKDLPPTQVCQTQAQVINNLRLYLQDAPNMHASHAAQAITAELQRLWQAADTVAAQGEKATVNLCLGSSAAAYKRTQEASDRHEEWLQEADARQQRSKRSAWQVAQDLAEEFGYSKHTIYKVILPLWHK